MVNISDKRIVLERYGKLFGKTICTVKSDNIDLSHNDKVREDNPLRLILPLKKYYIETIDITGLNVFESAGRLFVEFNGDPKLQFPIVSDSNPTFKVAGQATIEEAISAYENGKDPIFFNDRKALSDRVTAMNKQNISAASTLAEEAVAWVNSLTKINEITQSDTVAYYKSLGLNE